jgi:hypothetical protein
MALSYHGRDQGITEAQYGADGTARMSGIKEIVVDNSL